MSLDRIQTLARFRLEQAQEALDAAKVLHGTGAAREVINWAYYAMFYSILALLAVEKKETPRHKAAITLFDENYVKPGAFSKDFPQWLHEAFDLRHNSVYTPLYRPTAKEADQTLTSAGIFVSGLKTHLDKLLAN